VAGYATALAELGDAELGRMLARRPDLLAGDGPASFPELASRAGSPASLSVALRGLDLGALRLAELLAVVGLPATMEAVGRAAGPGLGPERLAVSLAELAELGIALPRPDGSIAGPRGLAAPFGNPGGLGPSVAELARVAVRRDQLELVAATLGVDRSGGKPQLVAAVAGALSDPRVVIKVLARADEGARRLLDQALRAGGPITVMGVGYGRFAGYPDAEPAAWLAEHGLLMPVAYNQLVVPREAVLGLRGGHVFPDWPEPPPPPRARPMPDADGRAAAAALRAAVAAEGMVVWLDRRPLTLIQAGTVAVRDLRRLAAELDLAEDEAALLLDLLVEAGVLGVGGPWEQRSLGLRPEADGWLERTRVERWAQLAAAWRDRDLAVDDHLLHRHAEPAAGVEKPRPLLGRRLSAAPACRRGLVELLTGLPRQGAVAVGDLCELLAWQQPLLWGESREGHDPASRSRLRGPRPSRDQSPQAREAQDRSMPGPLSVLDAAALLGLAAVAEGRAAAGPAAAAWARDAGADELAAAMGGLVPDGSTRFLVAGDLTVVAPGGLAPDVEGRLALLAERETGGGAATWRISDASLRGALDEGLSAAEVLAFLREHSDTPLPQALEYLVEEASRRHGRLRVGAAGTYLRGEAALVTQMVRSAAGRRLGLRELAPGVAVTSRPQRELLAELRKAGEAPVAEDADGAPRRDPRRAVRHSPRTALDRLAGRRAVPAPQPAADPAGVVARLRAAGGPAPAARRAGAARPGTPAATAADRGSAARLAGHPAATDQPPAAGLPPPAARVPVPARAATPDADETVTAPAEIAALCRWAADEQAPVELSYRRRDGVETVRVVEPRALRAGLVTAWCRTRQDERTFDLSRILWARPAGQPDAPAPGGPTAGRGPASDRPGGTPGG
jgi:hypothetical protein